MAGQSHPLNAREAEARRRNGQRSTDPRAEAGKRRVALDALRHGCRASPSLRPSPEAKEGEDKVLANKAKSDSQGSAHVPENTGEDCETNETQEI